MQQDPQPGSHLPEPSQAVYGISVAADLAGIGVQTLRLYERHGLLTPARSDGGTRRYSGDDIARLQRIAALAASGVNLAGIGRILDLEDTNATLHTDNDRLRDDNTALRTNGRTQSEASGGSAGVGQGSRLPDSAS